MLKNKLINPQLLGVLSKTGHTDMLSIVDAGFPIPRETERVDLAWTRGKPSWKEICDIIGEEIYVEKAYLAEEIKTHNPQALDAFKIAFPNVDIEFIPHEALKQKSRNSRAIVRTGEYFCYSNCIIVAGVAF